MTSTTEMDLAAVPEPLKPQREERSHRIIRYLMILLVLLSVVSGYATRPAINGQMRRVLRESTVVEVVRHNATWNRPFLVWGGRELVARHRTALGPGLETIGVTSYFSGKGVFQGSHSAIRPSPYARRQPEELERALLESGEVYSPLTEIPPDFRVSSMLWRLNEIYDLRALTSFELFPATLKSAGESAMPVMVVHLWCDEQRVPEGLESDRPACAQAQRVVLRADTNEVIRQDSLL